jgi:hypothetical protein
LSFLFPFQKTGSSFSDDLNDIQRNILALLKILFFLKVVVTEVEAKESIHKVDLEARSMHILEDWLRSFVAGTVPLKIRGSAIPFLEFAVQTKKALKVLSMNPLLTPMKQNHAPMTRITFFLGDRDAFIY